jgi:hypothetical protein
MIIIIISAVVFAAGIRLMYSYKYDEYGFALTVIGGLTLFVCLALLLGVRSDERSELAKIKAFEITLSEARLNGSDVERAAISQKIAEWNEKIAAVKYWNEGTFDIWHVDEFANHPMLK